MPDRIDPQDYEIPAHDPAYFKDIHTFVSTVGFSRSGSSLVGYLLTAHRNMIVAREPHIKNKDLYKAELQELFNLIFLTDRDEFKEANRAIKNTQEFSSPNKSRFKSRPRGREKYVMVPNQWQAHCESLQVLGIKCSAYMNRVLDIDRLKTLRENLSKRSINRLKFIFTLRNPYDMISTSAIISEKQQAGVATQADIETILHKRIKTFSDQCKRREFILTIVKTEDMFINRHEDMVASLVNQLSKLCHFLVVSAFPDYLNDCASVVHKKANKSRYELDWSEQQKAEVAEIIDKYHFLSGYSWDS